LQYFPQNISLNKNFITLAVGATFARNFKVVNLYKLFYFVVITSEYISPVRALSLVQIWLCFLDLVHAILIAFKYGHSRSEDQAFHQLMPFSSFCFSSIAAIFQDDNKYIINKSCGHKVALILTIGRKSQLPQENIEWGRKIWPCKSGAKSFGGGSGISQDTIKT
jgi:hypothetical protein